MLMSVYLWGVACADVSLPVGGGGGADVSLPVGVACADVSLPVGVACADVSLPVGWLVLMSVYLGGGGGGWRVLMSVYLWGWRVLMSVYLWGWRLRAVCAPCRGAHRLPVLQFLSSAGASCCVIVAGVPVCAGDRACWAVRCCCSHSSRDFLLLL